MTENAVIATYIPFPISDMLDYTPLSIRGIIQVTNAYGCSSSYIVERPYVQHGIFSGNVRPTHIGDYSPYTIYYTVNWGELSVYIKSTGPHELPHHGREGYVRFTADGSHRLRNLESFQPQEQTYIDAIATAFAQGIQKKPLILGEGMLATIPHALLPILHYYYYGDIVDIHILSVEYDDSTDKPFSISAYIFYNDQDYADNSDRLPDERGTKAILRWDNQRNLMYQDSLRFPCPREFASPLQGDQLPGLIQQLLPYLPLPQELEDR